MLYQTENTHGGDGRGRPVRLDFSVSLNPLGTPERVRKAASDSLARLDRYPDPCCRGLTAGLARYEGVPESMLLCGNGAAELIYAYCAALRPRSALELAPAFSEYSAALPPECRLERHFLLPEKDFALGEDFLERLSRGSWDVLFLCSPNNPTGRLIPRRLLEEIAAVCRRRGIRLFLDECFWELSDRGGEAGGKALLKEWSGLFLLKAFTKSYGLAGLRLGYGLSGDGALLRAMSRAVQPWNLSIPAQAAGEAAVEERAFLERARAVIGSERGWLKERLERLGAAVCPSQANFLLFYLDGPVFEPLLERGILLRDCSGWPGLGPGWYRAAVRPRQENRALIQALAEIRGGC